MTKIENAIIHLIGFPGVGKLTVAREICKQSNCRLIDAHAMNNLIFTIMRRDGKQSFHDDVWDAIDTIRFTVWDMIEKHGPKDFTYIFTNFIDESDRENLEKLKAMCARTGRVYIPIKLTCDPEEHKKRVVYPDREANMKMTSVELLERDLKTHQLIITGSPHEFEVDVTHQTPAQSAQFILEKVQAILLNQAPLHSPRARL